MRKEIRLVRKQDRTKYSLFLFVSMLTNMKESTVFLFCFDENSYGTSFTALDRPMTDEEKGENGRTKKQDFGNFFS